MGSLRQTQTVADTTTSLAFAVTIRATPAPERAEAELGHQWRERTDAGLQDMSMTTVLQTLAAWAESCGLH